MTSSGAAEDRSRDRQAELASGLEVDDKTEPDRLLDRQVAGLGPLEDAVDIVCGAAKVVCHIGPIGHQATVVGIVALGIDRGQIVLLTSATTSRR
jgi:hypothetical protein